MCPFFHRPLCTASSHCTRAFFALSKSTQVTWLQFHSTGPDSMPSVCSEAWLSMLWCVQGGYDTSLSSEGLQNQHMKDHEFRARVYVSVSNCCVTNSLKT